MEAEALKLLLKALANLYKRLDIMNVAFMNWADKT